MINILICDDERVNLRINKVLVEEFFYNKNIKLNIAVCMNEEKLMKILLVGKIDIAILDIDLHAENSGIEMAKQIMRYNPYIIIVFITSHGEFALDAFGINAAGFLQKPVDIDKFNLLFQKVLLQLQGIRSITNQAVFEIKSNRETYMINEREVYCIEKCGQKLQINTRTGTYIVYESLKSIQNRVSDNFIRIRSGMLINRMQILNISSKVLILKNKMEIPINKKIYKEVNAEGIT